jgi:hypothetical protein
MAEQENARWPSKKMQDGRANKCKVVEQKLNKNARWPSKEM